MSTCPKPSDFVNTEEWILHVLYEHQHPKINHTTVTLFQQLNQILQEEPSPHDIVNKVRAAQGYPPLADGEDKQKAMAEFGDVQYVIETLIEADLADGKHESSVDGIIYTELKVTKAGRRAAIRVKRRLEEGANALLSASERSALIEKLAGNGAEA